MASCLFLPLSLFCFVFLKTRCTDRNDAPGDAAADRFLPPSGAVMIRAAGKPLIWKHGVRGVAECGTEAELGERRLESAKCLMDPPRQLFAQEQEEVNGKKLGGKKTI